MQIFFQYTKNTLRNTAHTNINVEFSSNFARYIKTTTFDNHTNDIT